ncbi:MAG: hypothetical protein DMG69_01310 [Acidobacteria bacterium]|nr:MAG: hypothetical protein DMG69_01310 [Acidobacteriota bacterium]
MGTANSHSIGRRDPTLLRVLIGINFAILLIMISPVGTSREFYKATRNSAFADEVFRSIQVWVVASTLIATILFGRILWKLRRAALAIAAVRFEAILLLAWWLTLLLLGAYGFMLGMGG